MAEISWTRSAIKDIREIHKFISFDSEFYADIQVDILIKRVEILNEFPLSGRVVPEKDNEVIRELIEGNYRIFYKVASKKKVLILRVHHSSKNIR